MRNLGNFILRVNFPKLPCTGWVHKLYSWPEESLFLCRGDGAVFVGDGDAVPGESVPPSEVLGEEARWGTFFLPRNPAASNPFFRNSTLCSVSSSADLFLDSDNPSAVFCTSSPPSNSFPHLSSVPGDLLSAPHSPAAPLTSACTGPTGPFSGTALSRFLLRLSVWKSL